MPLTKRKRKDASKKKRPTQKSGRTRMSMRDVEWSLPREGTQM
jgi:hypothetical protein